MKISYYRTSADKLAKTFCGIAEKCYYSKANTLVITLNDDFASNLDNVLWTYSKKHFIPHAKDNDPFPEKQPVLISTELSFLNSPEILFTVNSDLKSIDECLSSTSRKADHSIKRLIILEDEIAGASIDKLEKMINRKNENWQQFEKFEQTKQGGWQTL